MLNILLAAALLDTALLDTASAAGDAKKGETLFMANCVACHGVNADGKGPAAAALKPPPKDFTDKAWWEGKKDADVVASIKAGRPGTAMMPFPQLTDAQLQDLVAFLRTKQPKG